MTKADLERVGESEAHDWADRTGREFDWDAYVGGFTSALELLWPVIKAAAKIEYKNGDICELESPFNELQAKVKKK